MLLALLAPPAPAWPVRARGGLHASDLAALFAWVVTADGGRGGQVDLWLLGVGLAVHARIMLGPTSALRGGNSIQDGLRGADRDETRRERALAAFARMAARLRSIGGRPERGSSEILTELCSMDGRLERMDGRMERGSSGTLAEPRASG